jgi:nitrite reductase/ring-hydroxylating ferredoxin subunit
MVNGDDDRRSQSKIGNDVTAFVIPRLDRGISPREKYTMAEWITITKKSDLVEGSTRSFEIKDKSIALTHVEGAFYAYDNACTHMELPLDEGALEGCVLQCPFHGAKFDLKTGKAVASPAIDNLNTYPVQVIEDDIQVQI